MAANGGSAERGRRMELDVTGENWGNEGHFSSCFSETAFFLGEYGG